MVNLIEKLDYPVLDKDYVQRDEFGRFVESNPQNNPSPAGTREGWYQDSKGSLYHYDGLIWDEVPSPNIKQLEYLG